MPIYEYICEVCQNKFEKIRSFSQADLEIACARCGSTKTRRALSKFNAHTDSVNGYSNSSGGCGSCSSGNCTNCNH